MKAAVVRSAAVLLTGVATLISQTPNSPTPNSQKPQTSPGPIAAPVAISSADVIAHLEKTIAWYRHVDSVVQGASASGDVIRRDNTQRYALQGLQLAFTFARAEAARRATIRQAAAAADPNAPVAAQTRNTEQVAVRAAERVSGLQARITDLDAALAKANAQSRDLLIAQRQELNSELSLAKEIQKTLQSMVSFIGTTGPGTSGGTGLTAQIIDLERSVPEARSTQANPGTAPGASAPQTSVQAKGAAQPQSTTQPQSEGVLGLIGNAFSLHGGRTQADSLLSETDLLLKEIDQIRNPLVSAVRDSVKRSDALASSAGSDDLEQLAAGQKEVMAVEAQFKQLSTVVVPLGEQQIITESARGALAEWRGALAQQYNSTVRYLLVRVGMLLAAIFFVLVVSEVWRRATYRYIKDPRRRRQFLVLRRVITSGAIVVLVALGFITEFGSIATYAGFLTAGIAVALQNPILSVVAYFFLVGKYGIRVGDRVTIAGVTGDVIDMGLVRIYMIEVAGAGGDLRSTGRVVVFSNAVLFQPAAIFKQMPGNDYAWHTVTLTLTRESDYGLADKLLLDAVNGVYQQYREGIEEQHAVFARSIGSGVDAKAPRPENRMHLTEAGLEASLRYPVQGQYAPERDQQILQALESEIAREPKLTLAPEGAPKLQQVA